VVDNPGQEASAYESTSLDWVQANGHDDVWAVGSRHSKPLFMHWDGTRWKVVRGPTLGRQYDVSGVASSGRDDIWVVTATPGGRTLRGLILHWNGNTWRSVKSPIVSDTFWFDAVTSPSPQSAWAVGYDSRGALIERWDGVSWKAAVLNDADRLSAVKALSASQAWAVGVDNDARSLMLHYSCA